MKTDLIFVWCSRINSQGSRYQAKHRRFHVETQNPIELNYVSVLKLAKAAIDNETKIYPYTRLNISVENFRLQVTDQGQTLWTANGFVEWHSTSGKEEIA